MKFLGIRFNKVVIVLAALLLIIIVVAASTMLATRAHNAKVDSQAALLVGGDAEKGRRAIEKYGCAACHTIPGIPMARALIGPNLGDLGKRAYIGGVVKNEPQSLVNWIIDPQSLDPKTAMPRLGVSRADATDIATYLYTLE